MARRNFFYAFHNKIMSFIVVVVLFSSVSFIVFQFVFTKIRYERILENGFNERYAKFSEFINTRMDQADLICRTVAGDKMLKEVIQRADSLEVLQRLQTYSYVSDRYQIEVYTDDLVYMTSEGESGVYERSDFYPLPSDIERGEGKVVLTGDNGTLVIKYLYRTVTDRYIIASGFTIDNTGYLRNRLKNILGSDFILYVNDALLVSSYPEPVRSALTEVVKQREADTIYETVIDKELYALRFYNARIERGGKPFIVGFGIINNDRIRTFNLTLSLTISILSILIVSFSYYITKRMTLPIRLLISASKDNTAGNEIVTVDYRGQNEMADLITHYNRMIIELKEKRDHLDMMVETRTEELRLINERVEIELAIAKRVHTLLVTDRNRFSEVFEMNTMFIPIESRGQIYHSFFRLSDTRTGLLIYALHDSELPQDLLSSFIQLSFSKYASVGLSAAESVTEAFREIQDAVQYPMSGMCLFYGVVNSVSEEISYVNVMNCYSFLQKKNGGIFQLERSVTEETAGDFVFTQYKVHVDQHDRLVCCSNIARESGEIEQIINAYVSQTSSALVDKLYETSSNTGENEFFAAVSSDFIFIKRDTVKSPDLDKIRARLQTGQVNGYKAETEISHAIFLKAIDAFESGKYDIAIRELNRVTGRYPHEEDQAVIHDILAHCYYRLESYHEAIRYWEHITQTSSGSYPALDNISITRGIIEEQKMRL